MRASVCACLDSCDITRKKDTVIHSDSQVAGKLHSACPRGERKLPYSIRQKNISIRRLVRISTRSTVYNLPGKVVLTLPLVGTLLEKYIYIVLRYWLYIAMVILWLPIEVPRTANILVKVNNAGLKQGYWWVCLLRNVMWYYHYCDVVQILHRLVFYVLNAMNWESAYNV